MKLLRPSTVCCRGFLLLSLIYLHAGYADSHPNPPQPCCGADEAAGREGMISQRQETRPQSYTDKGSESSSRKAANVVSTWRKWAMTRKQNREKSKLENEKGNVDEKNNPTPKPQTTNVQEKWKKWNFASPGAPKKTLARDSDANGVRAKWKKWNLRSKQGPQEPKEN